MAGIRVHDEGMARWITFDRPSVLNALSVDDLNAVTEALTDGGRTPGAVVFTGAGDRAFSAGMNVAAFRGLTGRTARTLIRKLRDVVGMARRAPYPTVAAVNGYCLGAAFELALACDIRIATDSAQFGLPEIKVGIPSVIDAALLQQHVGLSTAKEMILTGDLYPAAELERRGALNAVVPAADLHTETRRMLARLTGHSPAAMAAQKRLFETWQNTTLAGGIEASVSEFAGVFDNPRTADIVETYLSDLGGS